jgi:lipopolysaccharide transport system permease protein
MSNSTDSIVHEIDALKKKIFDARELWRYRELFYFFAWRDIKIKYKQTVLGFLWAVLQPLLMMIIFSLTLGKLINVDTKGLPYPVYVFSGLLIWNIFSLGLASGANSMINNATIIKKIYFPRLVIPASSVIVSLFDFLMAFILFVPILIYYGQPVEWTAIWLWPMATIVGMLATLGLGAWLAALNVKYRDFRYVIPFLIQVMFFTSPVIYPITMTNNTNFQYALSLSPMYAPIELFRMPITSSEPNMTLVLISLGSCVAFLVIGLVYFWRTQDFFADLA